MKAKIFNVFVPFVLGYWVGQSKHGWTPVISAFIFLVIDFFIIKFVMYFYRKVKNKNQYDPAV